jgi:L-fuculose-phosphate aldolase
MTDQRARLVAACRILFAEGHEHFFLGHASVREAIGGDRFWVKPSGLGLGEVSLGDLILLDLEGSRVAGMAPIHQEMPLHAEIYRRRPDVGAVVHTHPPFASALAASDAPFRIVSQDSLPFASGLARYEHAHLISTTERGRAVAEAIGDRSLVLLRNHGIAVAGATLEAAVVLAVSFERSVRTQSVAETLGSVVEIPADEAAAMRAELGAEPGHSSAIFEYLDRRQADRAG